MLEIGLDSTTHEEHIFIVRNKFRLGHSEKQYVEAVYFGVKALIRKELELADHDIEDLPEVGKVGWVSDILAKYKKIQDEKLQHLDLEDDDSSEGDEEAVAHLDEISEIHDKENQDTV